jgi:hypothetical protein
LAQSVRVASTLLLTKLSLVSCSLLLGFTQVSLTSTIHPLSLSAPSYQISISRMQKRMTWHAQRASAVSGFSCTAQLVFQSCLLVL